MSAEDDLGWEYFGPDPMNSPRMKEHMDWHNDPANQARTGNYGHAVRPTLEQTAERLLAQETLTASDLDQARAGLIARELPPISAGVRASA